MSSRWEHDSNFGQTAYRKGSAAMTGAAEWTLMAHTSESLVSTLEQNRKSRSVIQAYISKEQSCH